jgi:ankyrin repeat protein
MRTGEKARVEFFVSFVAMEKPIVSSLRDVPEPSYDLHRACYEGRLSDVQALVKNGADINLRDRHGNSPLGLAIHNKHIQVVTWLLGNGADPTLKSKAGWAPIREALASSSIPMVEEVYKALQVDSQKGLIRRMTNLKKALEAVRLQILLWRVNAIILTIYADISVNSTSCQTSIWNSTGNSSPGFPSSPDSAPRTSASYDNDKIIYKYF